jgi:hypothetical protein
MIKIFIEGFIILASGGVFIFIIFDAISHVDNWMKETTTKLMALDEDRRRIESKINRIGRLLDEDFETGNKP